MPASLVAPVAFALTAFDLTGVSLKLSRVDEHLDTLRAEVATFLNVGPHKLTGKNEGDPPRYVLRAKLASPPARLSVIIGDVVHNLRSGGCPGRRGSLR